MATPPPNLPLDPLPMKAPLSIHSRILSGLVGFCLLGATGCINKPAARPSQLYSNAGSNMGGPMRVAVDTPTPLTPPHLPIIVKDSSVDADNGKQPAPPPPPTLKSAAVPKVISPVPGEADTYFAPAPAQPTVLGGLFDSLFVPPAPPTPTTTSSAKYQEVK